MNKIFIVMLLGLFLLTACGPSEGSIQTAIAQTQNALPSNSPTFEPSITPIPTNESSSELTPISGTGEKYAWNYLSSQNSGGLSIMIARVLIADRTAISQEFDGSIIEYPVVGMILFQINNYSDTYSYSILPEYGTIQVGDELINLKDFYLQNYGFGDTSPSLLPGTSSTRGVWFGIKQTSVKDINEMVLDFDGAVPLNNPSMVEPPVHFILNLSDKKFEPLPEELK